MKVSRLLRTLLALAAAALAPSTCGSSDGTGTPLAAPSGGQGQDASGSPSGGSGSSGAANGADGGHLQDGSSRPASNGQTDGGAMNGGDGAAADSSGATGSSGGSSNGSSSGSSSGSGGFDSGLPTGACPTPTGASVTLVQNGSSYKLSNGLVTLDINANGQLTQFAKGGTNLMSSGDTLYVSESGGSTYYSISASSSSIVQQTADIVELSFVDTSAGNHDMDWDLHYVLRRGVSGFYYFLITKTGTSTHPNPATLSELRTVQRFDPAVLSNGYSGERHGQLPNAAQNATFTTANQIQDATYPLTVPPTSLSGVSSLPGVVGQDYDEGPVFSKYDWASYRVFDIVHGLYGNGYGAWLVSPSWEFYTGGPLKQELMVHHDNLILNMYHGGHFGSATTTASPASWQKLYGPNLVYVNTGTDDQVIADALAQGAAERSQWPYCWMNSGLYPLSADRGTVAGKLVEAHGQPVDGVMVVLAQAGDLLSQGYDYMFWAQTDAGGNFTIPEVRQGMYSVHAYATKGTIVDDTSHGEIVGSATVQAGANDLGTLTWSPPFHTTLLWSIGNSDHASGEFRFDPKSAAGLDNTAARTGRMYGPDPTHGVWTVPPATATYTIGTSTPQTDWYFAQSVDGTWTVSFSLATVPPGGASLTIGIAGAARNAHLDVAVNGQAAIAQDFGNDQSLYRSALQGGLFQMLNASVPASALAVGTNTATFTVSTKGSAGAGVYYDIVKMESD